MLDIEQARLKTIIAYLLGEGPLDGAWFGDETEFGPAFWWRTELRSHSAALIERLQVVEDAAKDAINIVEAVNDQLSGMGFSQHIVREGNKDVWRYIGNGEVIANRVRDFAARRLTP